jgi:hypothetical protein
MKPIASGSWKPMVSMTIGYGVQGPCWLGVRNGMQRSDGQGPSAAASCGETQQRCLGEVHPIDRLNTASGRRRPAPGPTALRTRRSARPSCKRPIPGSAWPIGRTRTTPLPVQFRTYPGYSGPPRQGGGRKSGETADDNPVSVRYHADLSSEMCGTERSLLRLVQLPWPPDAAGSSAWFLPMPHRGRGS